MSRDVAEKARECELAKLDENGRAVGMLNLLRGDKRGPKACLSRGGERGKTPVAMWLVQMMAECRN